MVSRSNKEIAFFILLVLSVFLAIKSSNYWCQKTGISDNLSAGVVSIVIATMLVLVYHYGLGNSSSEGFWDVSLAAQCKGGPYMWQGDSELATACRDLAKTPQGRCAIANYNCPTGYTGQPRRPFEYTPLSNDQWENEQCMDSKKCPCKDTGLCGMQQQPYSGDWPPCKDL